MVNILTEIPSRSPQHLRLAHTKAALPLPITSDVASRYRVYGVIGLHLGNIRRGETTCLRKQSVPDSDSLGLGKIEGTR